MLNTAQVALLVRPIAGEELYPMTRRVQEWVENGVVPPAGPVNVGRGRERTYGPESTLLAGIAAALSRWTKSTDTIRLVVSTLIRRELRPDPKWRGESGRLLQVIDGKLDAILVLQAADEPKGSVDYYFIDRRELAEFAASDEFGGPSCGAIIIDLPALWKKIGGMGFTPKSAAAVKAAVEAQ